MTRDVGSNFGDERVLTGSGHRHFHVAPSSQPVGSLAFLLVIILVVIVIGAGYYLLVMRKKK